MVSTVIDSAHDLDVPVVFALSRRHLAKVLKKKFNIGCVGIMSYAGAEVSHTGYESWYESEARSIPCIYTVNWNSML